MTKFLVTLNTQGVTHMQGAHHPYKVDGIHDGQQVIRIAAT
jgi:hypothetical protein